LIPGNEDGKSRFVERAPAVSETNKIMRGWLGLGFADSGPATPATLAGAGRSLLPGAAEARVEIRVDTNDDGPLAAPWGAPRRRGVARNRGR
jgi:hypothetical protein